MDPTVFNVFSMVFGRFSNGFQRFSVFSYGFLDELPLNGFSMIALHLVWALRRGRHYLQRHFDACHREVISEK